MEVKSSVLFKIFLIVLSSSCFMMISCGNGNQCSNIKNGVSYKIGESYDIIAKMDKEDFGNNYSKQYKELLRKIKELYDVYGIAEGQYWNNEDYESDNSQDENKEVPDENELAGCYPTPPDEFITKVRDIVEQNKKIYEETYKQIDNYTRKIPPMPWAYGCTIKGLVMYILHNPIIKCAVQYFDNYKRTNDETLKTFDEMVMDPKEPIDEWHNCLVTFIRLLKLTYEELESDKTDIKVHGKLWNQIQGLEYLLHFLCFGYRRGWFGVDNAISFLKVFLNILGIFDFSEKPEEFGIDKKNLKYHVYCCCDNGLLAQDFSCLQILSEDYLDSICCKKKYYFSENIPDIISKSNRANWIIQDVKSEHVFHFYLCKKASSEFPKSSGKHREPVVEEKRCYYIHDGLYEYQDFINKKLPKLPKKCKGAPLYYSIPFTYIISPGQRDKSIRQIKILDLSLTKRIDFKFWDSFIPLLSTDLNIVKKRSAQLYAEFQWSNEKKKKILLFEYFLSLKLERLISGLVERYNYLNLGKKQNNLDFTKEDINSLLSFARDAGKNEKLQITNILSLYEYYLSEKKKIDGKYPNKICNGRMVENQDRKEPTLQLLKEIINKMRWFLEKEEVVNFIVNHYYVSNKKIEEAAFIEENIEKIPTEIEEMFNEYVKEHFCLEYYEEYFKYDKLVHGNNGANVCYDRAGKYKRADVLMVNWENTGLSHMDLPIFRDEFKKYKFFESAHFPDVVK